MNVKTWLNRGYRNAFIIRMLEEEKEFSFEKATSITTPTDVEKVSHSSRNSVEENNIVYSDYSRLLDEKIAHLKQIRCEIEDVISRVERSDMYEILHRRYILFEKFKDIADAMYLSERQIFRIHKSALEKVERILKNGRK